MINEIDRNVLLSSSKFVRQKEYWLNKLSGDIAETEIPVNYNPGHHKTHPGSQTDADIIPISIPAHLGKRLVKRAKNNDLSIYIILLAGLKALIYRYTGSDDITILSPVNKPDASVRSIDNGLLIRDRIKGNLTFKELILNVRESVLEAYENQEFPPGKLVEQVENYRSISHISCSLKNIHGRVNIEEIEPPLAFSFVREDNTIRGDISYDPAAYEKYYVEQISSHFTRILENSIDDIDITINEISFLSRKEKEHLIVELNRTSYTYPRDKTLNRIFADRVEKNPDAAAVVCEGKVLTYRQLHGKSNGLAGMLKQEGLKAGDMVGLMFPRTGELATGIIGILTAGGTCLPIDMKYPGNRIRRMLEDSGAKYLLKQGRYEGDFSFAGITVDWDLSGGDAFAAGPANDRDEPSSASYAFAIYTSGSTGKPKGSLLRHYGISNHVFTKIRELELREEDVLCHSLSIGFVASIWQFFAPLFLGARLNIFPGEVLSEPYLLLDRANSEGITVVEIVPSLLKAYLELLGPGRPLIPLEHLRLLVLTGEKVAPSLVKDFYRQYRVMLVNAYGQSECSDDTLHYKIPYDTGTAIVPVGRPANNTRVYILGSNRQLQPPGVRGELYIGGDGLAAGYLNRPELTAEKFIDVSKQANLFSSLHLALNTKHLILFRTGDMVRWLRDGNIEFLGRIDHQVKIRGNRVELGEIESQLLKYGQIREAVLHAEEGENGNSYLCAYIVEEKPVDLLRLREYLSNELPAYMIPSCFIPLETLPLTVNGKIDRKALPDPGDIDLERDVEYAAPRNDVERKLVETWQAVLDRKTIGINDNFFLIGGDSIRCIQVASRMKEAGYELEVRNIFQYPTTAKLAPYVVKSGRIPGQSPVVGVIPLSPQQRRFFAAKTTGSHHFNRGVMLHFKEGFDRQAVKAVFSKIQEHHDALRVCFRENESGKIIQTNRGLEYPLALQVFDLRGQPSNHGKNVEALLQEKANDIQRGVDPGKGPLMKLALFHLEDGDRLLIVIHRLVTDSMSWQILLEDLDNLYRQYKQGKELALPLKTDSFKRWSEKLAEYAGSSECLKEKKHWEQVESTTAAVINKDSAREDNNVKDAGFLSFYLSKEETDLLIKKVNLAFGTEIDEILLTALGLAVRKMYGHNRLLTALEDSGRREIFTDVDIRRTIGWFTHIYPVLLNLSYADDLSRQIKEVKEGLRRIPNKGIGYGILKYLTPKLPGEGVNFNVRPQFIFHNSPYFDEDLSRLSSFMTTEESCGYLRGLDQPGEYEINVFPVITNKGLKVSIYYNRKQYRAKTIETLLNHYKSELCRIISFCSARKKRELTPADLTFKELSIEKVDELIKTYGLEDIYPLSMMQAGLLYQCLYDKDNRSYSIIYRFRIEGQVIPEYVEKSFIKVIERYDILRTVFKMDAADLPLQLVRKDAVLDFAYKDLSELREDRKTGFLDTYIKEVEARKFDLLSDSSLMRVYLLKLSDRVSEIIWHYHHILMDGWCLNILFKEILYIYGHLKKGKPIQFSPVVPYKNYIKWLKFRDNDAAGNYWRKYLENYDKTASLPAKKNPVHGGERREVIVDTVIERDKILALQETANRRNVTLYVIIQALWGLLLTKYSGSNDIVFGHTVSGRTESVKGIDTMIGLFINTLPKRIIFNDHETFSGLMERIAGDEVDSLAYQYFPLADILSLYKIKGGLFNHIIAFENQFQLMDVDREISEADFAVTGIVGRDPNHYDLSVIFSYFNEGLVCSIRFNENVYEKDRIREAGECFAGIVRLVAADPGRTIENILENIREKELKFPALNPHFRK